MVDSSHITQLVQRASGVSILRRVGFWFVEGAVRQVEWSSKGEGGGAEEVAPKKKKIICLRGVSLRKCNFFSRVERQRESATTDQLRARPHSRGPFASDTGTPFLLHIQRLADFTRRSLSLPVIGVSGIRRGRWVQAVA